MANALVQDALSSEKFPFTTALWERPAMTKQRVLAVASVKMDNARARVTEWRFAPGAATGRHRHEFDYVVVPLTSGRLKIVGSEGVESTSELIAGDPYFRPAGVEHDVLNDNPHEFAFIEIELK